MTDLHAPGSELGRLAFGSRQVPVENVVDEGGFPGTRNAGHAGENAERDFDVDVLEGCLRARR